MGRPSTDVLIIGGGPAGLAAAIAAQQQGLRVLVVDHARPPIDKACGEGLMPDSLEVLGRLGIGLGDYETGIFSGIRFISPNHSVDANFPSGQGLGIRRLLLHQALLQQAETAGAKFMWESRVTVMQPKAVSVNGEWITCNWIVGADGNESRVRKWAGLGHCRNYGRRIALRRHFAVEPWSPFVEIYWGKSSQVYVTPIGRNEVCVALISQQKISSFEREIEHFPELTPRLANGEVSSSPRGAITWSRQFRHVVRDNVALIGEAAGSVDAITGEGLALAFRQALALGKALANADLSSYEAAHRSIMRLPKFMCQAMLLMDKSALLRRLAFRSFDRQPSLFARMLAVHIGEEPPTWFGRDGVLSMGWEVLAA